MTCYLVNKGFLSEWRNASGMSLAVAKWWRGTECSSDVKDSLKYAQLSNSQEIALVSWISRKESLWLCKKPECVFVPAEGWGGSGYSLLSWSPKWTDSFSCRARDLQLSCRITVLVCLSHMISLMMRLLLKLNVSTEFCFFWQSPPHVTDAPKSSWSWANHLQRNGVFLLMRYTWG